MYGILIWVGNSLTPRGMCAYDAKSVFNDWWQGSGLVGRGRLQTRWVVHDLSKERQGKDQMGCTCTWSLYVCMRIDSKFIAHEFFMPQIVKIACVVEEIIRTYEILTTSEETVPKTINYTRSIALYGWALEHDSTCVLCVKSLRTTNGGIFQPPFWTGRQGQNGVMSVRRLQSF